MEYKNGHLGDLGELYVFIFLILLILHFFTHIEFVSAISANHTLCEFQPAEIGSL